jgi:hypothetical protein
MSTEQLSLTLAPGIQFSSREVLFPKDLTFDKWLECGRFLRHSTAALDFWKADWLRFGRVTFGIDLAAEAAGQLEFQTGELKRVEALNQLVERSTELSPEHHFVVAKAHLDDTAQDMWIKMAEKEHLSPRELQESIRMGSETRIKIDPDNDRGVGFASFERWYLQWKLLRKQIEDVWRDWTIQQIDEALEFVGPVEHFAEDLRNLKQSRVG